MPQCNVKGVAHGAKLSNLTEPLSLLLCFMAHTFTVWLAVNCSNQPRKS